MSYNNNTRSTSSSDWEEVGYRLGAAAVNGLASLLRLLWLHLEISSGLLVAFIAGRFGLNLYLCLCLGIAVSAIVFWRFHTRLIRRRARKNIQRDVSDILALQAPWSDTRPTVTVMKPKSFQTALETKK